MASRLRHLQVAPALAWTAAFFIAPLGLLLFYSFGSIDLVTFKIEHGWTASNYGRVFESLYLTTIGRSLLLSTAATIACLVIGFPVAYAISRAGRRMQLVLLVAIMVPFWTSMLIRTYAWVSLLGNQGAIEDVLRSVGLVQGSLDLLYTPSAVAIGIAYGYLPLMILPLFVALERIDPRVSEAAADLGATTWRTFRRVTLPLATPGIVAGCVMVGVPATGEYVIPAILGGNKTLMYGNVVADQFLNVGDWPFGSALAMTFMAGITVVLFASRFAASRSRRFA
jgi:ABC-type spermidine/putrescine transport system permease subunit I